jgi:acyl-CoA thioester hydrolase
MDSGFEWRLRVYYEDTDAGGVVYHARYLHFMERARTEWLRALGFDQQRLRAEQGVLFAVRRMSLAFVQQARLDQALTVTATLSGRGPASIDFSQQVLDAESGRPCCRATVNVACLDAARLRPTRLPESMQDALEMLDHGNSHGAMAHGL